MNLILEKLKAEKDYIDNKLNKLTDFQMGDGFNLIEKEQQSLLNVQALSMTAYSRCLLERIRLMEDKNTKTK
jgi:hypothetical protein